MREGASVADLLYGLDAIAAHVGLTVPQVKWQIAKSGWPTFKQGATVCARRSALDAHFASASATAPRGPARRRSAEPASPAAEPAPAPASPAANLYGHRAIAAHLGLPVADVARMDLERRLPTYLDDGCTVASTVALDHWNALKGAA